MGGAGKTRLAEEAARRLLDSYADGIWIADLVPVADPQLVADTVAAALGLDPAAGSDSMRTLLARLAPRKLLLVLDSCEHLLDRLCRTRRRRTAELPRRHRARDEPRTRCMFRAR